MIHEIMELYGISNYCYYDSDRILIIYEKMLVKDFVDMKQELILNKCGVKNIIIKSR